MKAKRVDCMECSNFICIERPRLKYSCKLEKRVMMRIPELYYSNTDFLFPRFCNEFKQIEK